MGDDMHLIVQYGQQMPLNMVKDEKMLSARDLMHTAAGLPEWMTK